MEGKSFFFLAHILAEGRVFYWMIPFQYCKHTNIPFPTDPFQVEMVGMYI